jgi:hypothetical protein
MRRADLLDMLDQTRERVWEARLFLVAVLAGVAMLAGGWYAGNRVGAPQAQRGRVVTIRTVRVVHSTGPTVTVPGKAKTLVQTKTVRRSAAPRTLRLTQRVPGDARTLVATTVQRVPTVVTHVQTAVAFRTVIQPHTVTRTRTRTVTDTRTVTQTVPVTMTVTVTCEEHHHHHHDCH